MFRIRFLLTRPVRLRGMGRFVDDILHVHDLAFAVPEAVADDVPGPFQLLQGRADAVRTLLADLRKAPGGVVPVLWQGQHHGEQPLGFQRQARIPQVMVGHHRIITGFLNAEYRHIGYLLPSVLKSVRFGGFTPPYHRPASHKGKDMGGLVCAAHRRKNRGFPTRIHTVLRTPGRA